MEKVGLLTCTDYPNLSSSDAELVKPLADLGIQGVGVQWDSSDEEWRNYDALVLRSTWNYHKKLDQFMKWVQDVEEAGVKLFNPVKAIRWNYDKKYLHELRDNGIKIIPTEYVAKGETRDISEILTENKWSEVVVKPSVGASAHGIKHLLDPAEAQQTLDETTQRTGALVQPVMKSIFDGEWSLIYFNGEFSHAALKKPGSGTIFVNSMYKGKWAHATPDEELANKGKKILSIASKLAGVDKLLYARVDGLIEDDEYRLMELELIEPGVYLHTGVAPNFAKAIKESLGK